ncbi:hypothetical protein BSQ39_10210 [Loigolactobacillus backii]|uniref:DUF1149 family protein n=1 Tax=Loigolactobacillus backii TaxID=375175 RepID=UPI000C1CA4FF|nr:DUF1149 family protein [Loigolactobacillus backii]PIO83919.1 hypothetical protein BSQ39_10210 [Loigolactobacillus backii]
MKTKAEPIIVEHFHYDRVTSDAKPTTDVQVSLTEVEATGDGAAEKMAAGKIFQFSVPFTVTLDGFQVSGLIRRIVQLLDFNGEPSDIPAEEMQKLSRPLVEYIETLTYQVTIVAIDHGVQLDFQPNDADSDKQ